MRKLLVPSLLIGLLASGSLARDKKEKVSLGPIAPELVRLLETQHITGGALDDDRSRKIFDAYFLALDPAKMYFRQSDIDAFAASRDELDDQFRRGEFRFAIEVGGRLLDRVEAVSALTREVLDAPVDLSRNEYRLRARDEARYPASDEELRTVWRKSVKSRLLEQIVGSGQSIEGARSVIGSGLGARHDAMRRATSADRVRLFIDVVTRSFDPHTRYLSPGDLDELEIHLRQRLVGIGAVLRTEKGRTLIVSLVPGGPAQREGTLRDGDTIDAVAEGPTGPWTELAGRKLREVVGMIRGEEGTTIRLRLRRDGSEEPATATIRRASVRLRQLEGHGEVLTTDAGPGLEAIPIGILRLPTFYAGSVDTGSSKDGSPAGAAAPSSTSDARRLIAEFTARGAAAIVRDLRGNAGGLLEEAIGVASLFLDGGAIVQIAERGAVRVVHDRDAASAWDGPLVVLTDRLTASASEIVAGALQDHGRALVVGDRSTHGKGTVQTLVAVVDAGTGSRRGALKVTTAQFYLPSGPSPQLLGVVPHVVLPSRSSVLGVRESGLAGALPFDEISPVEGVRADGLPVDVLSAVITSSQARRRSNAWFQEVETDLRRALEARSERWVPLERRKFAARRASLPTPEPSAASAAPWKWEPRIERDVYLDEVLAVTGDYVRLMRAK